jgi:hypothetical protein
MPEISKQIHFSAQQSFDAGNVPLNQEVIC